MWTVVETSFLLKFSRPLNRSLLRPVLSPYHGQSRLHPCSYCFNLRGSELNCVPEKKEKFFFYDNIFLTTYLKIGEVAASLLTCLI